jgi:tetratricopeptide (TPR) repeat protein
MLHLVVARHQETLAWLHDLPAKTAVTVYNAGAPLDSEGLPAHVTVHAVAAGTAPIALFLRHLQQAAPPAADETVVFTPGDPLRHAPAFLELLSRHAAFAPLQVLSCREDSTASATPMVRGEPYALATLAPLAHQQESALRAGKAYRRKHGLPEGSPLLAHFLHLVGLTALAAQAADAEIGLRAHGAMVAVRGDTLAGALRTLAPHLDTLALLLRADRNYPEVAERAWLHLLGQPFVKLEALAVPGLPAVPAPAASMARVVASIDAVLAQSAPRPAAPAAPAPVPVAHDTDLLRQRAQAAFLRGDASTAWELLQQALALAPRDIGLLADATQMAYAQQDTERALHCARRALAVDPGHVDCLFTLGMCLAATGEAEEALAIFERLNHGELAAQWQERQRDPVPPTLPHRVPVAA